MLNANLICEYGHVAYSPHPEGWITTQRNLQFCTHPDCVRRSIRVRAIDGDYQYVAPLAVNPPKGVMEECLD